MNKKWFWGSKMIFDFDTIDASVLRESDIFIFSNQFSHG